MAKDADGFDDGLDLDDENSGDSGSENSAPPDDKAAPKDEGQRISDLMSKWQSEQATSAKLRQELAAAKASSAGQAPDTGEQSGGSSKDAEEFVEFARENARNELFKLDPRLAEYGLDPSSIVGGNLAEMKASLKAQQALVAGIESRARNKIQRELGLEPDVATGASSEGATSFSDMSDEDFQKFIDKRGGGAW